MSIPPSLQMFRGAVRMVATTLIVPQGFTLSIAGTLAATINHRGRAELLDVWLFLVGAGFVFCLLALVSGCTSRTADSRGGPISGVAVVNVVPVAAMPAAVVGAAWIPADGPGFLTAGALAVVLYVTALAGLVAISGDDRRRDAVTCASEGSPS